MFSWFWGLASQRSGCLCGWVLVRALSDIQVAAFLLCPHMAEKDREKEKENSLILFF